MNKKKTIHLNLAEIEGFSQISKRRDDFFQKAQELDQRLQQMALAVVKHREEDITANWTINLTDGVIMHAETSEKTTLEKTD